MITDLQMHGLSGLELQEALRSRGHRTQVILMTIYPNESSAIVRLMAEQLNSDQTVRRYIADRMHGCANESRISSSVRI